MGSKTRFLFDRSTTPDSRKGLLSPPEDEAADEVAENTGRRPLPEDGPDAGILLLAELMLCFSRPAFLWTFDALVSSEWEIAPELKAFAAAVWP